MKKSDYANAISLCKNSSLQCWRFVNRIFLKRKSAKNKLAKLAIQEIPTRSRNRLSKSVPRRYKIADLWVKYLPEMLPGHIKPATLVRVLIANIGISISDW
jgi:hypothetical protein